MTGAFFICWEAEKMRKAVLLGFTFLLTSGLAGAETLRVGPGKAHRLPEIFSSLKDGDRVVFERGTYRTHRALTVSGRKNITVEGEGRVEVVLSNLDDPVFSVQGSERVLIKNLQARHLKPNEEYACEGAVVEVRDSQQIGVTGCRLDGCGAAGVYAMGAKDLVVFDNDIFNNSFAAVWLYDTTGIVRRNRMHDNASDLITGGQTEVTLLENEVEDNQGNDFLQTDWARSLVDEE